MSQLFDHLKLKALCPLPATGRFRHRFVSSCLHFAPLFTLSGIFILKCSASRAISSGRSVAIAKECIFSSDELRIALLTLILLQGADKLGLGRLSPPFLVSAYRMRFVAHSEFQPSFGKSSYSLVHFQQFALRGFDLGQIEL